MVGSRHLDGDRPGAGVAALTPGPPAVCPGTVLHHRVAPTDHRFTYPVSYVWLDPDHPDHLTDRHPLWSARRPAPAWFRRSDYLGGGRQPLGAAVRDLVTDAIGAAPTGPVRTLAQVRTWGWLFNPITIHLLWPEPTANGTTGPGPSPAPTVAVLEVTNTPWKERHCYVVPLQPTPGRSGLEAEVDKALHVSPFLDERFRYHLTLTPSRPSVTGPERLVVELDVIPRIQAGGDDEPPDMGVTTSSKSPDSRTTAGVRPTPILRTRLAVDRLPADRSVLTNALTRNPLSTHRVSTGIHHQAFRLWRKGVPFVAHPRRRHRPPLDDGQLTTRGDHR